MELAQYIWSNLQTYFGVKFLLSPVYLAATVIIVYVVWSLRGRTKPFLTYMLPKDVWTHPSTNVDIKVALFNGAITATGALSALLITPYVTFAITTQLAQLTMSGGSEITGLVRSILAGTILFLVQDFCRYWNHYLHHEQRFLWPFHAVHHSAEVMTPITFLRAHPMYSVLQILVISALVGIAQGLILFGVVGTIDISVIYGSTLTFNAYVFFGGHLRHSHIWISYGRLLEHILISPAQHQIHHSSNPKHHDCNYGEIFAIWDWMFGTLYVPDGYEDLNYGLADRDGNIIPQKHPTLKDAMIGPFIEVWEEILKGTSKDPENKFPAE
ncbi:Sterol desaturase/sphingolipid hydroxylase, fatty acid hydroxylase superfamily [Cognatiyoonia koreensis]|uniref:Sterol desaturase/sphingolipid hydroxylase, fatty acid hydroxylase superfamily n=2 Tax=Cognatiyoonia koreensis TaxID=364200 RepID=A0A1I0PAN6_9RHOB|nr:Sterol desaturase/sphingolipid hydroxylase, fatty acid hydroxylase superfamily [Cognatiyoonia koreensis]